MKSLGRRMPRTTISFFIFLQYDDNHCAFAWKLCERGNNENERRNKTESTQFNTCLTLFSVFCFRYSMLWSSSCLASCHFTTALCCSCTFDANNSCCNASVRMKQHTDSLGLRCIWLKYKLACSQHKNPTIKPTVAHAMKHSLPVTFRRQCSHRCSQSERKAAERWGVRKRLLIFKRRREPRSTLHLCFCSICRSEIGNGAIESLEAELWENPCCVMILVNTAFVLTVYCVLNLPRVNAAAILCCYSLHAFKVFASWDNKPSSITTNWEIKCVFVLGWLILLLFFFVLIWKQRHSGALLKLCCMLVYTGSLCGHYFSLPQEGTLQLLNEPTTIVTTAILLISHLYQLPDSLQVLHHYSYVWHWC